MRPEIQRVTDLCEDSATMPQEDTMYDSPIPSVCSSVLENSRQRNIIHDSKWTKCPYCISNECLPEVFCLTIQQTEEQLKNGQLDTTQVARFRWMYDDFQAHEREGHSYDKHEWALQKFKKLNKQVENFTRMISNINLLAVYIMKNDGQITYDCIYCHDFNNCIDARNKKNCIPLLNHLRQDHAALLEIQVPENILLMALECVKRCLMSGKNIKHIDDTIGDDHHRDDCKFRGNKISVICGQKLTSVRERTKEVTTEEIKRIEEDKENAIIDSLSRRGNSSASKNKTAKLQVTRNPITAVTAGAPVVTTVTTSGIFERNDQTRTAAVVSDGSQSCTSAIRNKNTNNNTVIDPRECEAHCTVTPVSAANAAVISGKPAVKKTTIKNKNCEISLPAAPVVAEKRTVGNDQDILTKLPPGLTVTPVTTHRTPGAAEDHSSGISVTRVSTTGATNAAQAKQGPPGRSAAPVIINTAGSGKNLSSCVSAIPIAIASTTHPKNRSPTKAKPHVSKATPMLHRENGSSGLRNDGNKQRQIRQKPAEVRSYLSSARPSTSTDMRNNELRTFVKIPSKNGSSHAQDKANSADKQRSIKRKIADVTEAIDLSVPNKRKKDNLVENDVSRLENEHIKKILTTNLQTASAQDLSKVKNIMQGYEQKRITIAQARQQTSQHSVDFNKHRMFMDDAEFHLESATRPRSYAKKMGLLDKNANVFFTRLMRLTPSKEFVEMVQQMSVHFAKLITHFTVIESTKRGRKTVTKGDLIETVAILNTSACLDIENVKRRENLYSLSRCYEYQKFLWPATRLLRHVKSYYFDNMQRRATTLNGIVSNCYLHKDSMLQCLLRTNFTASFISELQLLILRFQIMTCFTVKDRVENDCEVIPKVLKADIFDFLDETSFDLHDAPHLALLAYRKRHDKQIKNYFTELK